jgi:two-component system response regulator AtoC
METLLLASTTDAAQTDGFVCGESPAIASVNGMIAEIAQTDIPVLIVGESGTGKEVYAKLVHRLSRAEGTLPRKINCKVPDSGRIVAELQEVFQKVKNPEAAGSVLLDGIDELDLATQRVFLSLLSEVEWQTDGGGRKQRLISTATRSMEAEVESGRFRRELYFRLNGVCLRLPPLRERKEDIAKLSDFFIAAHSRALGKRMPQLDNSAVESLQKYHWPGNIRELENLARKIVAIGSPEQAISELRTARVQLPMSLDKFTPGSLKIAAKAASRERERELILEALQRTKWNRKRAARELQISYKSLLYKIKQIESPETILQERGRK